MCIAPRFVRLVEHFDALQVQRSESDLDTREREREKQRERGEIENNSIVTLFVIITKHHHLPHIGITDY